MKTSDLALSCWTGRSIIPHAQILMSRVAREVADLEGQNAVICITEDESVIPSAMRGLLMLCRCPHPGPRQPRMILEEGLRWTTPSQQTITAFSRGHHRGGVDRPD